MTFLTPEFLVDPARRPPFPSWAGIGLFLRDGSVWARGLARDGLVADGVLCDAPPCLLAFPGVTGPGFDGPPQGAAYWHCLWPAERAAKAARSGDWEAAGRNLDGAYGAEREHLPPDRARDLAYAAARSAGAWGGRVSPAGMVLLCPPERIGAVRKAVAR
jgi:hypothetical protein